MVLVLKLAEPQIYLSKSESIMTDNWLHRADLGVMVKRALPSLPMSYCASLAMRRKYGLKILSVEQQKGLAKGRTSQFCIATCCLGSYCGHCNAGKKFNGGSLSDLTPGQLVVCELYDGCQVMEVEVLKALVRNLDCCLISLIGDSQFLALPLSLCPCSMYVSNCIWARRRKNSATTTTRLEKASLGRPLWTSCGRRWSRAS
jgi:hypothetical protein